MSHDRRTRRGVLRCIASLGLGGLVHPALARRGGQARAEEVGKRTPLIDNPAEFKVYVGTGTNPDGQDDFAYPSRPTIAGEDPVGGLFDAADIEKTPTGRTLHHVFRLLTGFVIRRHRGKPYVLVHDADGRYTERGQNLNFEAKSEERLRAVLEEAGLDPRIADLEPFATLAGGKWRAIGTDVVQLAGDPAESRRIRWAVTRVDLYRGGEGPPDFELSALYVLFPNLGPDGSLVPANPKNQTFQPIPAATDAACQRLISVGRSNLGGQ